MKKEIPCPICNGTFTYRMYKDLMGVETWYCTSCENRFEYIPEITRAITEIMAKSIPGQIFRAVGEVWIRSPRDAFSRETVIIPHKNDKPEALR